MIHTTLNPCQYAQTRSDSAKLVGLLEQSKTRSSWLEQQHRDAGCSKQRDQKPLIQTHTQGRYGGISSNRGKGEPMHSRHTPASQPYVPTAIHASNNSTSSQEDQEQALFNAHRQRHTHAGVVVGLNRPSEWASPGSVLGKEYQRTAFRALLRRGGIM
jgi:hypothetical protein